MNVRSVSWMAALVLVGACAPNEAGEAAPEGKYTFNAYGSVNGTGEELSTAAYAHVESVSLGGGTAGVHLNLKGLGGIELTDAIEVAESI